MHYNLAGSHLSNYYYKVPWGGGGTLQHGFVFLGVCKKSPRDSPNKNNNKM